MNCKNCKAVIDYNYLTACPQCGAAVEGGDLPQFVPEKEKRAWHYYFANIIYVLTTSAAGAFTGAVMLWLSVGAVYKAVVSPDKYPGEHCAQGMMIGMLSIMIGAFLATVGVTVFSVKHPIFKRWSKRSAC